MDISSALRWLVANDGKWHHQSATIPSSFRVLVVAQISKYYNIQTVEVIYENEVMLNHKIFNLSWMECSQEPFTEFMTKKYVEIANSDNAISLSFNVNVKMI